MSPDSTLLGLGACLSWMEWKFLHWVYLWYGQLLANLRYPRAQWTGCWIQYISGLMWHLISWSIHSWSSHYKPPATAAGNYMFSCFLSPLLPSPLQAAHRQHTIRKLQHQAHLPYVFCFGAYRAGPSLPAMPGHSKSQPFRAHQCQGCPSRQGAPVASHAKRRVTPSHK